MWDLLEKGCIFIYNSIVNKNVQNKKIQKRFIFDNQSSWGWASAGHSIPWTSSVLLQRASKFETLWGFNHSDTRGINAVGCYKLLYLTIQITSCSPVHFSVSSHLPCVLVSSPVIDVYRDAVFFTIQRCFTLLIRRQDQKAPDYLAIGHVSTLTVEKWQKEFNWKERLSFKGVQKRFTKPFTTFLNWSLTFFSARTSLGHFCILAERQFE